MKKILSLALAAAMAVSVLPVAYAAEGETSHENGTQITYIGTQEEAAGGAGDVWTVTVPAKMVPGDTGTVKAEGMWNSDKFLNVGAPSTVTLTYGAQSMDVDITFKPEGSNRNGGFSLIGNSVDSVSKEADISVADASRLFGTWEGTIVYTVDLIEKGDVNRDGVIDDADKNILSSVTAGSFTLEDDLVIYADMNGDGVVDIEDESLLSRAILGYHTKGAINGTAATE